MRDPGKILPDTKSVEACEIKEKDFLVLMVSKVSLPVDLYGARRLIRV